ncbi:MAG TPA: DEAD/DEAH box helicase [Acidimicrobiia bacterium]|nr:DEAD/DEAH box helicase [Acidimicrobiia bacterium]
MKTTVPIRNWQFQALEKYFDATRKDFLCVATPGAGKTTFALVAARRILSSRTDISRIIIVVPSAHLKEQWADAGARLGLILDTEIAETSDKSHGYVTTYQSVAKNPAKYRLDSINSFAIFDEIHHAGDEKSWGEGLMQAFGQSPARLCLSGTPFRSDTQAIPFVRYDQMELVVDYEYSYEDALKDGDVVRPVHFRRLDGHMEWLDTDGEFNSFTFNETIDTARNQQRLRAALDVKGDWLKSAVARAHSHLQYIRRSHPKAGGLVICSDQDHAKQIAKMLSKLGSKPTVVLSDDNSASKKILEYSKNDEEWIVAVRMVSEGVDIPRLCVGLFATATTTELFFRQAVGRIVRSSGNIKEAMMFLPNDPRLISHANNMATARVYSRKQKQEEDTNVDAMGFDKIDSLNLREANDQMSMFEVVSSTPIYREDEVFRSSPHLDQNESSFTLSAVSNSIDIELPPLPLSSGMSLPSTYEEITEMKQSRSNLRQANADLVHVLSGLTDESHAKINSRLNKLVGIQSIVKASNTQLEKRKKEAHNWVASLRKKRVS